MPIIKKFLRGVYEHSNLFKIRNPSVTVGDNEVKEITPFRDVIQTRGSVISSDDFNEMQKNGVYFVETEYSENFGSGVDAYVIKNLESEQELFEGLKLKFVIPKTNNFDNPVVVFKNNNYSLKFNDNENLKSKSLIKDNIVNLIYTRNYFLIELLTQASENTLGIAKLYSNAETEADSDKVKEIIEKNTGNKKEYIEERMTTQEYERRVGQGETFEGEPRYGGDVDPGMVTVRKATGETVWTKLIKSLDHSKILTAQGLVKFLSKLLKPAGEKDYGLINYETIKQVSPKPDLSPYQLKTNFWKYSDPSLKVVGTNSGNGHSYAGMEIEMFTNTGEYMGSFHTNKGRAYYKVPNRAGGGWCEIMDNHDMMARDIRMNNMDADRQNLWAKSNDAWNKAHDAQLNRVYEIRLAGFIELVRHNYGAVERGGYVVTGIKTQATNQDFWVQMRVLQFHRNGQWLNAYFA